MAGSRYRYLMAPDHDAIDADGSYTLAEVKEIPAEAEYVEQFDRIEHRSFLPDDGYLWLFWVAQRAFGSNSGLVIEGISKMDPERGRRGLLDPCIDKLKLAVEEGNSRSVGDEVAGYPLIHGPPTLGGARALCEHARLYSRDARRGRMLERYDEPT